MAPVPNLAVKESAPRSLTPASVNPRLPLVSFPLPHPVFERAAEIQREIDQGQKKPYSHVIAAHPGDPQGLGQPPISFFRQVLTAVLQPGKLLLEKYPSDVQHRAKSLLANTLGGTIGSYTKTIGMDVVRHQLARYFELRDGVPSDPRNIFLSNGATGSIKAVMSLFNCPYNGKPAGVMLPVPMYPLYSATLTEYNMYQINYYLDEAHNWEIRVSELRRAISEARSSCNPRAIVIISPGNPNGSVLTRETMEDIIKFAYEENLFILADEVYHNNVYGLDRPCLSFKRVMYEMGGPYRDMELASFISASKSYVGECGFRGGCCELFNVDPEIQILLYKHVSSLLCPNTIGQSMMYLLANPPVPGEPSYEQYLEERTSIHQNVMKKAAIFVNALNAMPGIQCNPVNAAFYAFPRIFIPDKAVAKAKALGVEPDHFYAMELVERAGICCCPGHLFYQKPGTYHVRIVFAISMENLIEMIRRMTEFQKWFMEEYK